MSEYLTNSSDSHEHAQARQAAAFIEISNILKPRMAETGDPTVLAAVQGLLAEVSDRPRRKIDQAIMLDQGELIERLEAKLANATRIASAAADGHDHARQVLTDIASVFGRVDDLNSLPTLVKALDDRHRPGGEVDQLRADLQRYRDDAVKWETAAVAADRAAKQAHTHAGNMSDRLWRLQLNCGWTTTGGDLQFQVSQLEERLPGDLDGFKRLIAGHEEARNLQFEQLKVAQAELQASRENLAAVRGRLDALLTAMGLRNAEDPAAALALAFSMNLPSPDWRIAPTADQPTRWFAHKDGTEGERVVDSMLEAMNTAWWRNVDDVVRDRTADLEQRVSELKQALATSAKKREAAAKAEAEVEKTRHDQRAQLAAELDAMPAPGGTYFMCDLIAAAKILREKAASSTALEVDLKATKIELAQTRGELEVSRERAKRLKEQRNELQRSIGATAMRHVLPARASAPSTEQGAFGKYMVQRCDGRKDNPDSTYLVLRFNKNTDTNGPDFAALEAYVNVVKDTHPAFADALTSRYLRHRLPPRMIKISIERETAGRRWRLDYESAHTGFATAALGRWVLPILDYSDDDTLILGDARRAAWQLYDSGLVLGVNPSPPAPVEQG